MANQLGKFSPKLATITKPLRDLPIKQNQWTWGQSQGHAFEEVKRELSHTPVLALYDPNRETTVSTDASSFGLGAVLLQRHEDAMPPVAYASRAMTATEKIYSQIEKKALAAWQRHGLWRFPQITCMGCNSMLKQTISRWCLC